MSRKTSALSAVCLAALAAPATVLAQGAYTFHSPLQPDLELTTRLTEQLDLRFGLTRRDDLLIGGRDGVSPRLSAMVDWEFGSPGLRLTGGAIYGESPTGRGLTGLAPDGASAGYSLWESRRHPVTPYVGLGWDGRFGEEGRFGFQLDMGVMFESFSDTETDSARNAGPSIEEEALLRQEFESFRYTPLFSAGVRYRF